MTTIISRIILNKATNKEKQKQIENANKEVIRILKPYVVEKNFLNEKNIMCIIKSIARKFELTFSEIYNVREICEELMRKVNVDKITNIELKEFVNKGMNPDKVKRFKNIEEIEKAFINIKNF